MAAHRELIISYMEDFWLPSLSRTLFCTTRSLVHVLLPRTGSQHSSFSANKTGAFWWHDSPVFDSFGFFGHFDFPLCFWYASCCFGLSHARHGCFVVLLCILLPDLWSLKSQGENVSPDIISYNSATWHALYGTFAHLDRLVYVGDVGSPCVISSRMSVLHPLN